MANQLGMGLPQINTQGVYDILGNSMSGGLGAVYAMRQQEQEQRQRAIQEQLDQNTLTNNLADNPVLQAKRNYNLGVTGVHQGMLNDGLVNQQLRSGAQSEIDVNQGRGAVGQGQARKEMANQALQVKSELEQIEAAGESAVGPLAMQETWKQKAVPLLQKMGVQNSEAFVYNAENWKKFQAMTSGMAQSVENDQRMANTAMVVGGRSDVANIAGQSRIAAMDRRLQSPSYSQWITSVLSKPEASRSPSEQEAVDSYFIWQQAGGNRVEAGRPGSMMNNMEQRNLIKELEDPTTKEDRKAEIVKRLATIDKTDRVTSPAKREEPTTPADTKKESPRLQFNGVEKGPDGKEYPKADGYHIEIRGGKAGYVKDKS